MEKTATDTQKDAKGSGWFARHSASLGWWLAGLAIGALAMLLLGPNHASLTGNDGKDMNAIVRAAILAQPEIIPEAVERLQQQQTAKLIAAHRAGIETPFAGAFAGNPNGDVTLVEFFDFNCPYCKQSTKDVEKLLETDPNLKVVFHDMPVLGPASERFATVALAAAQQGKYPQFYRAAFAGQGPLDEARLTAAIAAAGLDRTRLDAELADPALHQHLQQTLELARSLGMSGTPTYVVGDQMFSGAVGYDALKAAIAEARGNTNAPA